MENQKKLLNGCAREQHLFAKKMIQKTLKTIDRSLNNLQLLTLILTDMTYLPLEQNDLFPLELKGYRCGCMVVKTNLKSVK